MLLPYENIVTNITIRLIFWLQFNRWCQKWFPFKVKETPTYLKIKTTTYIATESTVLYLFDNDT